MFYYTHFLDINLEANPVANMVPITTKIVPIMAFTPTVSPKNKYPHKIPKTGIIKVTVKAEEAPSSLISQKYNKYANPVHTAPSAKTAAIISEVTSSRTGMKGTRSNTSNTDAHILPCALLNGSTLGAFLA